MTDFNLPLDQPSIDALPETPWDAAIVGAGPAGAIAGLCLAERGWRVLLLDRHRFPRDKVCGDGLIPDAIHCLERTGLLDRIRRAACALTALRVYSPSRHVLDLPGTFLTIKRYVLDHLLVQAATARGATLARARVTGVAPDGRGRVQITTRENARPVTARIAVIATGADVSLLEPLGLVSRTRASAIALRCYVRSSLPLDRIVVSFDRSIIPGYAWIFPLPAQEFNVGVGIFHTKKSAQEGNLKDLFRTFLNGFPLAVDLLAHGEIVSPPAGARLRCGLAGAAPYKPDNILAIGETIGATFPFTGEGIGKAMETGELAGEIIHKALETGDPGQLEQFARLVEERLHPKYLGYHIAEHWLSSAWINDFMVQRVRKSAYLRDAAAGILSETVDPRTVFSIRGIVRSMWK